MLRALWEHRARPRTTTDSGSIFLKRPCTIHKVSPSTYTNVIVEWLQVTIQLLLHLGSASSDPTPGCIGVPPKILLIDPRTNSLLPARVCRVYIAPHTSTCFPPLQLVNESVVALGRALCSQSARSIPLRRSVWSLGQAESFVDGVRVRGGRPC